MEEEEWQSAFDEFCDQPLINERVLAAADFIGRDKESIHYSPILHAQVDDLNLDDHWFEQQPTSWNDPEVTDYEREAWTMLAALTEQERVTVIRIDNRSLGTQR